MRGRLLLWGWPVLLALLVTAPLLIGRGFALVGDMVFVPQQPWKGSWLGLDGSVPRAVPGDALVSALTVVVPGDLLQKGVLVGLLVVAGAGAVRLTDGRHPVARAAACSLYVWNPYVYERLAIGHWALLCGYAALPWVVVAARRTRDEGPRAVGSLLAPVALAAWTSPTGGVLATLVAVAVLAGGGRLRTVAAGVGTCVALNLPWLVPGVLNVADQRAADVFGVSAFAARADTPWGVLGSLLSLGGSWKSAVDPAGRDSWLLSGIGLALAAVGLLGLWLAARDDRRTAISLAVLGGVGLLLAWLPTHRPGAVAIEWLVREVPGAGILRDSHKWVALLALGLVVGLAAVLDLAIRTRAGHGVFWALAATVAPLVALPALAWGLLGTLSPATYPSEWSAVSDRLAAEDDPRTVVLPFGAYRRFGWNDDRAMLDPAPRYFPGTVITNDALEVSDGTVAGESRTAQRIADAQSDPERLDQVLEDEGIRWVVVEKGTPGSDDVPSVPGRVVHDGAELRLVDRGSAEAPPQGGNAVVILFVDLAVAGVVVLAGAIAVIRRARTLRGVYTQRRSTDDSSGDHA